MNGRMYDPLLGRMLSADTYTPYNPMQTQSFNRYAYVFNNPLSYTDPSGHEPITLLAAVVVTASKITAAAVAAKVAITAAAVTAAYFATTTIVSSSAVSSALASSAYGPPGNNWGYFNDANGTFSNIHGSDFLIQGNNPGLTPRALPPDLTSFLFIYIKLDIKIKYNIFSLFE